MQVIVVQRNIPYAPAPNEARIILSDQLPPLELITSAFAFVFDKNRFVMTHLVSRGWDVPGGHREPGEAPIETAKRELLEEAGAEAEHLKLLGYQEIRIDAPKPEGYPHPYPQSYQVFYCGRVGRLYPFAGTKETYGRGLFGPEEAMRIEWVKNNRELYEAAYKAVVG